ncbi:1-phosphofructokinase [Microbacterium hydrocarbonoxydans]|uniref:1-phosphofructokinase n=1 Tax=Microbacterium hydrocarbonoxydans TaxID=273678 RepID=UPI0007BC6AFC|nr:1-phosphofructokinase [Microbacterium hydrocarbonoxydans]GAT74719.1 fructose-1-phosphate kinase [Microbacterium sp. HM58-2]
MIVALTPNPSIDRAVAVDALTRGRVLRAESSRIDPGGKGVNVARALTAMGADAVAVIPVGGPEGALLDALLDAAGVARRAVTVSGAIRMNTSILEPDGTTTKLNEPGPLLTAAEADALLDATLDEAVARGASWVAGCGSLPPGAPADLYAGLVERARARGIRVVVDSSGEPFAAAVGARPTLVKPNREELAELAGRELDTLGAVIDEARRLIAGGIELVAVSLGRDGAVLVGPGVLAHARAVITDPVSTVGAGDCMLAGLLHGLESGLAPADALAEGVRWGAAAVRLPGSQVPSPADLDGIHVELAHDLDPTLPVRD